MDRYKLTHKVNLIVAEMFNLKLNEMSDQVSPITIEAWDSLAHLNLALTFEQEFDVQLSPEEINKMIDLRAIIDCLAIKLKVE